MGVEVAQYIGQLVPTNPPSTDGVKEGDNHLRLIKAALQATFPSLTFAIEFKSATKEVLEQTTLPLMRAEMEVPGLVDDNELTGALRVKHTDDGAAASERVSFIRTSASPTADDLLHILRFLGMNSLATETVYGGFGARLKSPTAAGEAGELYWEVTYAGAEVERLRLGRGLYTPSATDGDKGPETFNLAGGLYFNGAGPFLPPTLGTAGQALLSTGLTTTPTFQWPAIVQIKRTQSAAVDSTPLVIPYDTSKPQSGEGKEFFTRTITPKSVTNILEVEVLANVTVSSASANCIGALFLDAEVDARASAASEVSVAGEPTQLKISYEMVAGSLTEKTFRFRAGPDVAATLTLNGEAAASKLGDTLFSSIKVTERAP
jgi:hypothetical protein